MGPIVIVVIVALLCLPLGAYLMKPKCPQCGARALRQETPEERGAPAYTRCGACDWVDADEAVRRAAKAQEEAARRAKIEAESRRHKEQAPARSILWLLRYVAMADQELHAAERAFFIKQVKLHFPEERDDNLNRWLDDSPPNPSLLSHMLDPFRDQKPHLRQGILRTIEEMANADGRILPIERERVEEIRRGLGL